ncbi:hypothetical protein, partial [Massilia antarctica]|uniref:hypothetical protein n=1 Tax=Massilia antarctica TaxID=2765360 RepID=UPI0035E9D88D
APHSSLFAGSHLAAVRGGHIRIRHLDIHGNVVHPLHRDETLSTYDGCMILFLASIVMRIGQIDRP